MCVTLASNISPDFRRNPLKMQKRRKERIFVILLISKSVAKTTLVSVYATSLNV